MVDILNSTIVLDVGGNKDVMVLDSKGGLCYEEKFLWIGVPQ